MVNVRSCCAVCCCVVYMQLCYIIRVSFGSRWKPSSSSCNVNSEPSTEDWKQLIRKNIANVYGNVNLCSNWPCKVVKLSICCGLSIHLYVCMSRLNSSRYQNICTPYDRAIFLIFQAKFSDLKFIGLTRTSALKRGTP